MLADAAGRPLASWQALRDAVTGTGTEAETALADAAASADALGLELDDTAAAAGGAGAAAREAGAAARDAGAAAADGAAAGRHRLARGHRRAGGPCREGARHRRRHRPGAGRGLHLGRERGGRLRQDRQARLPRHGRLDDRRSGEAGGAALHPRPDRQRPVGRARRRGWSVRQRPACGRRRRRSRAGAHGSRHGLRRRAADACGRLGGPPARRGAGHPAARRAGALPARSRQPRPGQRDARNVTVHIHARDAESFRQSRTQVAADIARAVSLGRRGL